LTAIFYGFESWSLILRGKHRPRVFENRVLRRVSGSEKDKILGGRRKLHNEELHNLNSSSSMIKSRRIRCTGQVTAMGE
jgi:hypothetical protein